MRSAAACLAFLIAAAAAGPARAAGAAPAEQTAPAVKPPRRKKHPRAPTSRPARHRARPGSAPLATSPTAVTWPRRLAAGRWTPPAADALERLLQYLGEGTTDYTPLDPPAAVLVLDDAAFTGSPGDALLARLTADAAFGFGEDFWRQLPPQYDAARARAGWESFHDEPRAAWENDPHYLMYRKALHGSFEALCRDAGRRACVRWRAALLTGLDETALQRSLRRVTADALRRPVGPEAVGDSAEDAAPAHAYPALRLIPEMRDLVAKLQAKGFDVWMLSSSSQYAALEAARLYGVHPTRVVGVRQKVADGKLTADVLQPIPEGSGLAEAVTLFLGRPPALAVGGLADQALLDFDDGRGLRVLLAEPGAAPKDAARKGWVVQPPFSPMREPQEAAAPALPGAPAAAPSGT